MSRAIELAKKGVGWTSPNPMVGCVIVKDGKIIGEGYHSQYGGQHAEVGALKAAGKNARGAVLYTNLEPCCHQGKTSPCTAEIIKEGVREVHMAVLDPNPQVSGNGKKELEQAGIKVVVGEYEREAQVFNEVFVKYITSGKPFVIAKWAMTLDGKIATHTGESKWITGEAARKRAHELRHQYDAVMVGVNTVIADDPELTIRHGIENPRHPIRIVVDSEGKTPLNARVLDKQLPGKTIIATTQSLESNKEKEFVAQGAEVMRFSKKNGNWVDLSSLIVALGNRGIASILVEGGGELLWSAFEADMVDKAYIFVGSKVIGGRDAKTPVGGLGVANMTEAKKWEIKRLEKIEEDILIEAYPRNA